MFIHLESMAAVEVGFIVGHVIEDGQGGAAKKDSEKEVNAQEVFMRVNAKYNLGIQSLTLDKNIVRANEYFSAAYNELSDFWKKHPGKVSEDMVRVMAQILRRQTSNAVTQAERLLDLSQAGLSDNARRFLLENCLGLAKFAGNADLTAKIELQMSDLGPKP